MPASKRGVPPSAAKIGNKLRERRVRKGKSRDRLGFEVGVSGQQIARYENAENVPSAVMLGALAKALDCTPNDLLDGDSGFRTPGDKHQGV